MVKAIFGLCVLLAALPVAPAFAAPSGEQVVQGEATFTQDGNTTIIDTGTHETIVQYDSFDIYQDEIVEINQPTDDSRILNHIPHGDPTVLNGTLLSNGFVFIVNPAGVFAGDTAIIDVGGLVAAAGDLSYEDFLAGEDRFTGLRGDVEVAEGALIRADQSVLLLGRRVANYGTVIAEGGLVAFVAGDNAVLGSLDGHLIVRVDGAGGAAAEEADFALTQAGTVDAGDGRVALSAGDTWSLAMNHTGVTRGRQIELEARGDGIVQVAGTLDASAAGEGQTGGSIRVAAARSWWAETCTGRATWRPRGARMSTRTRSCSPMPCRAGTAARSSSGRTRRPASTARRARGAAARLATAASSRSRVASSSRPAATRWISRPRTVAAGRSSTTRRRSWWWGARPIRWIRRRSRIRSTATMWTVCPIRS
jgi:filamentous hemagglutinin family protein